MNENNINSNYTKYYSERKHNKVYPTEFVVRTLLSNYPNLNYKKPTRGDSIIDIAFGDGRNTAFLCELGLDTYGIEITQEIVEKTEKRLKGYGFSPKLKVGRNSNIPFENNKFDYILACHCCYYCDEGENITNNLKEYYRILKPNGVLIASVADKNSYIFEHSEDLSDGTSLIKNDPYKNRNGYRLHGFSSENSIKDYFSNWFTEFSCGHSCNDYFGICEQVFWVVCKKQD